MAGSNPAPTNLGMESLPTPNVIDVLFVEIKDTQVTIGKTIEYGTAHPNKSKYPNHKLVFIGDEDEKGKRPWYYACDWDKQDQYNAEISYPYGRTDAPRYTRTYILPRQDYQPLAYSSTDPVYTDAILVGQEMQRVGIKELDSLYVKVQRIFDIVLAPSSLDGLNDASAADGTEYGISVTYPYSGGSESVTYPMVTWRIPVKHSAYVAAADLSACPIVGYTALSIVEQEYEQDPRKPNTGVWVRRYEKIPSRVNYSPRTHPQWGKVHIFSFRAAESYTLPVIGSSFTYSATAYPILDVQTSPARGSVITVEVTCSPTSATGTLRTDQDIDQIFCVSQIVNQKVPSSTTIPARGSFYSNGSKNGYVLEASLTDDDGTNATLTAKLASTNVTNITEYEMDELTGTVIPRVQRYSIGATAPTGLDVDASGRFTVTKRLGCNYWVSTTASVSNLPGPSSPITWYGTEIYNWPKVLKGTVLHQIYAGEDHDINPVAKNIFAFPMKEAYRGACAARYEEWWQKDPPSIPVPVEMIDVGVSIGGVYSRVDIEPCLHEAITYFENNPGADDRYEDFSLTWTYAATNHTDWPASIFFFEVSRLGGGFRCKRTTIFRPNSSALGGGLSYSFSS